MSRHQRLPSRLARQAAAALVIAASGAVVAPAAHAASPFESLTGSWSGGGRVVFEGGQSERLRCHAQYRSSSSGRRLGLSIRCASASNAFDLQGDLAYHGGRVSGSWNERSLGASGSATGRANSHSVVLHFSGAVTGSMSLALSGSSQTVAIASQGTALRAINVSLRRR